MMATIKPIDGQSVHHIQSGQVIADGLNSAVKELVENSLDANASSIEVRFKNYGLDSLEVVDNGDGITPDNYESIALEHYTSKLRTYEDLDSVSTFGFRGEALSSLCALSNLYVITATANEQPKGTRLEFHTSGKLKSRSVTARKKGTTVTVESLFKTLPVRRKELERKIKTEYSRVLNLLQAYASICVGVKFSVFNQPPKGKTSPVFATKGNPTTRENIANVFGSKTLVALVPLDLEFEMQPTQKGPVARALGRETESKEVKIRGHISRPVVGEGRQAPDRQMFFVNGRPCNLPQIAKAINEVYKTYNVTQSPFIFADIQLDTNAYDVNVSPDKRTILLHDQNQLLESLRDSLTELFEKHEQTVPQSQLTGTPKLPAYRQLTLNRSISSSTSLDGASSPAHAETSTTDTDDGGDVAMQEGSPTRRDSMGISPPESRQTSPVLGVSHFAQRLAGARDRPLPPKFDAPPDSDGRQAPFRIPSMVPPVANLRGENPFQASTTADGISTSPGGEESPDKETELPVEQPEDAIESSPPRHPYSRLPTTNRPLFRSPRKDGTTTITIGDRTTVTTGQSRTFSPPPPSKRRRYDDSIEDGQGQESGRQLSSVNKFASALGKFALPGSQLAESTKAGDATLEGIGSDLEDEDLEEPEAEADLQEADVQPDDEMGDAPPDDGKPGDVQSPPNMQSPEEANSTSVNQQEPAPLFLPNPDLDDDMDLEVPLEPEPGPQSEEARSDQQDPDADYVPEFEINKQAKLRAARLLAEAESKFIVSPSEPISQLLERPFRLLNGSSRASTLPLSLTHRTTLSAVQASQRAIQVASSTLSATATSAGADLLNPPSDDAAEERLTLTVSKEDFLNMKIKGQFNKGFILATRGDDLFIIDQHASDEKYNFETLQRNTVVQNQPLVVPKTLDLMAMDEVAIADNLDVLRKNGFVVDVDPEMPTGRRCKLISLPMSKETIFDVKDLEELIHLIHQSPGSGHVRCSKVRSMFAMRACRKSVMVGKALPTRAMENIVRHMGELDKPWNCPHGRPTMRHLAALGNFGAGSDGGWREDDEERGGGGLQWGGEKWNEVLEMYAGDGSQDQGDDAGGGDDVHEGEALPGDGDSELLQGHGGQTGENV